MITREVVDAIFNRFLSELETARVSSQEEAETFVDFMAINFATGLRETREDVRARGLQPEEDADLTYQAYTLALDTVSDAVKQIIRAESIPERHFVYVTAMDLLAGPETN